MTLDSGTRAQPFLRIAASLFVLSSTFLGTASCLRFPSSALAPSSQTQGVSPREQRLKELRAIAEELRTAILAEDIDTLLKYDRRNAELEKPWGEEDFKTGYGIYEADRLLLRDRKSWLYCQLFDTPCTREIARKHGGLLNPFLRISVKDFLVTNAPTEIRIVFGMDSRDAENLDGAIIFYVRPRSPVRLPAAVKNVGKDVPFSDWGYEFVSVALEGTKHGWRYAGVMFTVPVEE